MINEENEIFQVKEKTHPRDKKTKKSVSIRASALPLRLAGKDNSHLMKTSGSCEFARVWGGYVLLPLIRDLVGRSARSKWVWSHPPQFRSIIFNEF